MSLRDDFEEWLVDAWSVQPDFSVDVNGNYCDERVDTAWRGYQAATERAVRIVEEEQDADYDDHRNRVKTILRRLKDES